MTIQLTRRHAVRGFAASLAGAIALPSTLAEAAAPDRKAAIEFHKRALIGLIRDEFPPECDGLTIFVNVNWRSSPLSKPQGGVHATGYKTYWEQDQRLKDGGAWLQKDLGWWTSTRGLALNID
jgi:hypothetical protein